MKQLLTLFFVTLFLSGCNDTPESVKKEIADLQSQRSSLQNEVNNSRNQLTGLQNEEKALNKKLEVLHIYDRGERPVYIVTLKLTKELTEADIDEAFDDEYDDDYNDNRSKTDKKATKKAKKMAKRKMKNTVHTIKFDIAVDRSFYESVSDGDNVTYDLKTKNNFSLFSNSSMDGWRMVVYDKQMRSIARETNW